MIITTKFKVKDEVFTLNQNKVEKGIVSHIEIHATEKTLSINNHITLENNDPHNRHIQREDNLIFATKQELLNSL